LCLRRLRHQSRLRHQPARSQAAARAAAWVLARVSASPVESILAFRKAGKCGEQAGAQFASLRVSEHDTTAHDG